MKVYGISKKGRGMVTGVLFGAAVLCMVFLASCGKSEKKDSKSNNTDSKNLETTVTDPAEMVLVEGGTFQMGGSNNPDETPVHSVTVDNFYICKYEVTQKEWEALMGESPSLFKGEYLPVETVSWYDAVQFCNLKSAKEGLTPVYTINDTVQDPNNSSEFDYLKWTVTADLKAAGYRLPTEAEWEFAARGGSHNKKDEYSGSNIVEEVAWHKDNSDSTTHPIGTKSPNELGIYDMSGNVWEWCWDWYEVGYYTVSPGSNPTGPSAGATRVLRGGSWDADHEVCRVTLRFGASPDLNTNLSNKIGIRLVRTAQ